MNFDLSSESSSKKVYKGERDQLSLMTVDIYPSMRQPLIDESETPRTPCYIQSEKTRRGTKDHQKDRKSAKEIHRATSNYSFEEEGSYCASPMQSPSHPVKNSQAYQLKTSRSSCKVRPFVKCRTVNFSELHTPLQPPKKADDQKRRVQDLDASFDSEDSIEEAADDLNFDSNSVDSSVATTSLGQPVNTGLYKKLFDIIHSFFNKCFFLYANGYFTDNYLKECRNIGAVGTKWLPRYHIENFRKAWRKLDLEALRKRYPSSDYVKRANQLLVSLERPINLMKTLDETVKYDFYTGVFYKIMQQICALTIPYTMSSFMSTVSSCSKIDVREAVMWCLIASGLTFMMGLFNQHNIRLMTEVKGRAQEQLRNNLFVHLLQANIEFSSIAHSSFLSKMLFFECTAVGPFYIGLCSLLAAPISILYASFIIYIQFRANPYLVFILGYVVAILAVVYWLNKISLRLRRRYKSIASRCAGLLEEAIRNHKYIKVNSLQNLILMNIWNHRKQQRKVIRKINICDTIFDFIFNSPLVASTLILYAVNKGTDGSEIDATSAFSVIATINSLGNILSNLNNCLTIFQDYKPASALFSLVFQRVSRTPKIALMRIELEKPTPGVCITPGTCPYKSDKVPLVSNILSVQHAFGIDEAKINTARLVSGETEQISLEKCTFIDKSKSMRKILEFIFKEDYTGERVQLANTYIENTTSLKNTSVSIKQGSKVCVMGVEESGSQFFMDCLSNEHELCNGILSIKGRIVHCDLKRSHILEGRSILENIILDNMLYQPKLDKLCSILDLDFKKFSQNTYARMQTVSNLSEFDKAKIILARCMYQKFDILTLSKVFDTLTSRERVRMFDCLVSQYLVNDTVVYTSNDPLLAAKSTLILLFKDGRLEEKGTFRELSQNPKSNIHEIVKKYVAQCEFRGSIMAKGEYSKDFSRLDIMKSKRRNGLAVIDQPSCMNLAAVRHALMGSRIALVFSIILLFKRALRARYVRLKEADYEYREAQILSEGVFSTFSKLIRISGSNRRKAIVMLFSISASIVLFYDIWVGWWSSDFLGITSSKTYFSGLLLISLLTGLYQAFRDVMYNRMTRRISSNIYYSNLKKIVRASIRWYELFNIQYIVYNMNVYLLVVDDDFAKLLLSTMYGLLMIVISLLIANVFYPGIFLIITLIVLYYARSCLVRVQRANRIWLAEMLAARYSWFGAFVTNLTDAVSLRHIGKEKYLFRKFEEAAYRIEEFGSGPFAYSIRWLGVRTAGISAFLVFWVYLCPTIMAYWDIWHFTDRIWLLGLVLTWSGRLPNFLSEFMDNTTNLQYVSESAERLLELQNNCPIAFKQDPEVDLNELDDELTNTEMTQVFTNSSQLDKLKFRFDRNSSIIEITNLHYKLNGVSIFKDLNLKIKYGDHVALIQKNSQSVTHLMNLLMGFEDLKIDMRPRRTSVKQVQSEVTIFGRDIFAVRKYNLRRRECFLAADPVVFSGTIRDNIDPYHQHSDESIVRVLHYFGLHKAYGCLANINCYIKMLSAINTDIDNDRFSLKNIIIKASTKSLKYLKRETRELLQSLTASSVFTNDRDSERHAAELDYCLLPPEELSWHRTRKWRAVARSFIIFRGLLLEVRKKREVLKKDEDFQRDVMRRGVRSKADSTLSKSDVLAFKPPSGRLTDLSGKLKDKLSTKPLSKSKIENHRIENSKHKDVLTRLLFKVISTEDKKLNLLMRRIINLTRVILEQPALLLMEEEAFWVDTCENPQYMDVIFASFPQTTILCKMSSGQLNNRFNRTAIFNNDVLESVRDVERAPTSEQ